tara:strand:+ start:108 stop:527 length:420 start_codon:yes stop_codon:yes gene_type:complete
MIGSELFTVDQLDANSTISIQQDPLHTGAKAQAAAMFLKTTDEGLHHGSTPALGKIKAGLRFKPFAKQCCHRCRIGIRHGHSTDQETEQINPMAQEGILKVAIHQRTEGTAEMTQSRQMGKQATAASQQWSKTLESTRR